MPKMSAALEADALEEADEPLGVLHEAALLMEKPGSKPEIILRRMRDVSIVLGVSLAFALGALIALMTGLPTSEPAKLFTVFVLLGAAAVTVAAIVGLGLIAWGAYLQQRVQALEADMEAQQIAHGVHELMTAFQNQAVREQLCSRAGIEEAGLEPQASKALCSRLFDVTEEFAAETLEYDMLEVEAEKVKVAVTAKS